MKIKNTITSLAIVLSIATSIFISQSNQAEKDTAQVDRVLGKYVFVMSEPTMDYEVVDEISTVAGSMLTGRGSIAKQIENMVKRANKRAKKDKIEGFDGIITKDGDRAILIKFK